MRGTAARGFAAIAVLVCAFAITACGGSKSSPHTTDSRTVSPKLVQQALRRTASQPGYAFSFKLDAQSSKLGGQITAQGHGYYNNSPSAGLLKLNANLPSLLSLLNPLALTVVVGDQRVAVKLPPRVAAELSGEVKPWVVAPVSQLLGLAGLPASDAQQGISPALILRAAAARAAKPGVVVLSHGTVNIGGASYQLYSVHPPAASKLGKTLIAIDRATGLVKQITTSYAGAPGTLSARATITFTAYAAHKLPAVPLGQADTTPLNSLLKQLGSIGA